MALARSVRSAVPTAALSALLALAGPAVPLATGLRTPVIAMPDDPTPAVTPEPSRPAPPGDVGAAKAYRVFERSCAACHQTTAPSRRRQVQQFGNVLDLAALASDSTLVEPGNADASPLYTRLLAGHESFDLAAAAREPGSGFEAPEPIDVAVIREWIEALTGQPACTDRTPVALDEVADLATRWVAQLGAAEARDTRFVSLAHLHNACTPAADLAGYRQAVQKLMNSLSWSRTAGRIEAVGDGLVLLAFRLADFGWVGEHWETLSALRPAIPLPPSATGELVTATATSSPILPADWLAHAATRPEIYARLLGLPPNLDAIESLRGFDLADGALAGKARRAALMASAESRAPRIVERHGPETGVVWLAYDLAPDTRPDSLLAHPLLPYSGDGNGAPDVEETRLITTLPNGFLAFARYGDDDTLAGDPAAVPGRASPVDAHAGSTPRGCLACHGDGLALAGDQLRQRILGRKADLPAATAEKALALYAEQSELEQQIADDNFEYRRAQIQAGIDPDLRVRGLEPIVALAGEHERDITLPRFAAELDLETEQLAAALAAYDGADDTLARRLLQGPLSRTEAESLAAALGAGASPPRMAGTPPDGADRLALWTGKRSYAGGEEVTISATATRSCYLTIVNVDRANRATVIFPNAFEQANLLEAGQTVAVPGPEAPYRLRLADRGTERFVAICARDSAVPRGISHDFERQLFTALGNWPVFLTETLSKPAAERSDDSGRREPRRRGRRAPEPPAAPPPLGPGIELRTAIDVTIE